MCERQPVGQRVGGKIPRKPRQNVPPEPFKAGPACRERKGQRQSGARHSGGKGTGDRRKHCQQCRKTEDGRQGQPSEPVRLDLKTFGDPEKPGYELAQSKQISQSKRDRPRRATQHNYQHCEGDQRKGQDRIWWQGQDKYGASGQGHAQAGQNLNQLSAVTGMCV